MNMHVFSWEWLTSQSRGAGTVCGDWPAQGEGPARGPAEVTLRAGCALCSGCPWTISVYQTMSSSGTFHKDRQLWCGGHGTWKFRDSMWRISLRGKEVPRGHTYHCIGRRGQQPAWGFAFASLWRQVLHQLLWAALRSVCQGSRHLTGSSWSAWGGTWGEGDDG